MFQLRLSSGSVPSENGPISVLERILGHSQSLKKDVTHLTERYCNQRREQGQTLRTHQEETMSRQRRVNFPSLCKWSVKSNAPGKMEPMVSNCSSFYIVLRSEGSQTFLTFWKERLSEFCIFKISFKNEGEIKTNLKERNLLGRT